MELCGGWGWLRRGREDLIKELAARGIPEKDVLKAMGEAETSISPVDIHYKEIKTTSIKLENGIWWLNYWEH